MLDTCYKYLRCAHDIHGVSRKLYLVALKNQKPHDNDLVLYRAPFRGIDVHNNTMGACHVVKPRGQKMAHRDEWENAFFKSEFNQSPKDTLEDKLPITLDEFIWHTT